MLKLVDGLTFDDVLLVPQFSKVKSRKDIDISVKLSKGLKFSNPVIPANMKTVTGKEMAKRIADESGLAILHRFMTLEEQLDIVNEFVLMSRDGTPYYPYHVGVSVGVKEEDFENVKALHQLGAEIFCIDVAHGDSVQCVAMTEHISKTYPDVFLIAGNVATADAAERLWRAGADCVKVGVGPGSLCTTRIETGNGVPQLTALADVANMKRKLTEKIKRFKLALHHNGEPTIEEKDPVISRPLFIIADGGIKNAGDIVKALCFSDMVMAGNLFAGTDETPGEILQVEGKRYKNYVGSSTHKTNHVEGVMALVPTKGPVKNVLTHLCEGLKSGLSYQGCNNLVDIKNNPQFVRITNAGLKESHAHDVITTG